ncbi:ABC transporter ATP-binding protein [Aquimarina sp. D1M17]|uniref:ABC transporter ATP-binding protein n=1 Tax=Aquimarina acroporae TaxID=2937283 RepID=UPI0020C002C1|nr:ABC transporter ATP-binding protein [Aquimarina acroporae]MCK8523101.1 ABC transporter ATP-binding protein [Aquimarina acroporae]
MILEATHINKYFKDPERHQVLHDVSLQLHDGELISVYGESGSGKSTLLYILSTLDTDFDGSLQTQGRDIKSLSSIELTNFRNEHIGFVYQFHYLLPEFNVLQNIMLPAMKLRDRTKEEIKADAMTLLEEIGMKDLAFRPSYKLSGGQQQRVAIARALINNPNLIVADEPTGNLDQKNTEMVFELLKDITENKGKTVVMATHNPKIYKNSHRAIEMIDGFVRL